MNSRSKDHWFQAVFICIGFYLIAYGVSGEMWSGRFWAMYAGQWLTWMMLTLPKESKNEFKPPQQYMDANR